MNESIKQAILDQANHELFAANSYLAMAMWCEDRDYKGFAKFFYEQASEEREHAQRFFKHLLDRSVCPTVSPMEAPKSEFNSLRNIAEHAQALERQNSENIHRCYQICEEVSDYPSKPMLLEFIAEQVEEEAWAGTMVTLANRAECSGATYALDRHIIKDLADGEG